MDRVLQHTGSTASVAFYEDGVAADPGAVTLDITRLDGTAVATGTATSGSGTNPRTFNLNGGTHTTLLDTLRLDWISSTKGTLTTYVEVVGGFVFSTPELRALLPDETAYPTGALLAMRTVVEQAVEEACGIAFVPRYTTETFSGDGCTTLDARWPLAGMLSSTNIPLVGAVRSATVNGAAVTSSDIVVDRFEFYYRQGWRCGRRNITIGYEHGAQYPPDYLKRGALLQAKSWLISGPIDERAQTFAASDGVTYGLLVAGASGRDFDIPEMIVAAQRYSHRKVVIA